MIDFQPIFAQIMAHATSSPDREVCGLVTVPKGKLTYRACRNVAHDSQEFEIHPEDYITFEAEGIVAVVHSHTHGNPEPSMADRIGCEKSGLPWLIVGTPNGAYKTIKPEAYQAPLIGRPFVHGVLDCFSLARDYYAEVGIAVCDFERVPDWWEKGDNLLTPANFAKAGFRVVTDDTLQLHDGIIMQNGLTDVPNHVGMFVGDGLFLHHSGGRLSCRQPYGGYWAKVTTFIVRHESLC